MCYMLHVKTEVYLIFQMVIGVLVLHSSILYFLLRLVILTESGHVFVSMLSL